MKLQNSQKKTLEEKFHALNRWWFPNLQKNVNQNVNLQENVNQKDTTLNTFSIATIKKKQKTTCAGKDVEKL